MSPTQDQPAFNDGDDSYDGYEPLREELRGCVEDRGGMKFLRHRFCNESIVDLDRCRALHECYDRRVAEYDRCFEAHDYEGCLNCVDIYFQPEWLSKDVDFLPHDRYWLLLRRVYENQLVTIGYRELFEQLFRARRPGRELLMTEKERGILARLPERLNVFRGYSNGCEYADGVAWTLDERQARWYANHMGADDEPMLASGVIFKHRVWAYLDGGDILLPSEAVKMRRDEDALDENYRRGWGEVMNPPFDVALLLGS